MPQPELVLSEPTTRPRRLVRFALLLAIVAGLGWTSRSALAAPPPDHQDQLRFMWAMAGQESGWDDYARNRSSGAFGRYQIMPFNWPVWAEQYLGDGHADQTPFNQQEVAYGKLRDLYIWLGSWKRVAYWWLTGSREKDETKWSTYARGYVGNIMRLRQKAPAGGLAQPPRTSSQAQKGDWRRSARDQALRRSAGGKAWPTRGRLRDGQVVKVNSAEKSRDGLRWIRVVTTDGRLGWLSQSSTVPTRAPASPARWSDVKDSGLHLDRRQVRPRPR